MEKSLRLVRDSLSRPWGFRLQGGIDTGTPLAVQRVFSGSPAESILNRGDVILSIDGKDCRHIAHKESLELIRVSGGTMHMVILRDASNNSFSTIHDDPLRATMGTPKRQQLRSQSQFTTYATPNSPSLSRMTQSVYQTSHNDVEDVTLQHIESDPDYDFMRKSVSERRQKFNAPQKAEVPIKPARGRIQSYRPFTEFSSPNPAFGKRPEFGWCPSEEKMRAARMNTLSSTSVGHIHQQTPIMARAQPPRPSTAMYSTSTLPNNVGTRSAQAQHHTSTVVLQSSLPSQQTQPTAYRPPQQSSQQLSSHVATLPRPARSFSTSHAPSNSWSPTVYQATNNDVFGENNHYTGRGKPLKINLYESEPQQYSPYQGKHDIHPAFPVNSPHARGSTGGNSFFSQQSSNVRYIGALDGTTYHSQETNVTINTVSSKPSAFTSKNSTPTVHYIRKASPARNLYSQPPSAATNVTRHGNVVSSSSAFVPTRNTVGNREPPQAINSSDF